VIDKETKKPRGYAFIEYVHTRDMKSKFVIANAPCILVSVYYLIIYDLTLVGTRCIQACRWDKSGQQEGSS
jgi:hypothetical protein